MKRLECDSLDDYLLGWLLPAEAAAFERHLSECEACRREQALQQSIDGTLARPEEVFGPPPPGLAARVERHAQTARRRRRVQTAVLGAAIAASLLVVLVVGGLNTRQMDGPSQPLVVTPSPPEIESAKDEAAAEQVASDPAPASFERLMPSTEVTLTDPSSGIVVDRQSHNPDITVVWVYPTSRRTAVQDN